MRTDDLDSQVDDIRERVRKLETQDPLGNASVRRGSTRFIGNESLKVIGSAVVSGWLIVTGNLKGVGTFLWEGVMNIVGPLLVTGAARFLSTISIEGATVLKSDLTIDAAGRIIFAGASPLTLSNSVLTFSSLAALRGTPNGLAAFGPDLSTSMEVSNAGAALTAGSRFLNVTSSGTVIAGPLRNQGITTVPTGATVYALASDASGNIYRRAVAS